MKGTHKRFRISLMQALMFITGLLLTGCMSRVELSNNSEWFVFEPDNRYTEQSLIGMEDWNDEPAGTYGRIHSQGDKLIYQGEEIKLWGINNTYGDCAPDRELADKRAAFYRKYGINAMRLHKYADQPAPRGIQTADSFADLDSATLDRMDYFVHVLKENGIYTKLSPTFGVKFGRADTSRIPFHREIGDFTGNKNRIRATYGAIYLSEELQDLQIEQTIRVLEHLNPYTGRSYATDPAIFCVELFNEDALLWHGNTWCLQRYPTLRKRTSEKFSVWLLEKYGNEESWRKAWGTDAIISDVRNIPSQLTNTIIRTDKVAGPALEPESLEKGNVAPWYVPWAMDNVMQEKSDYPVLKQRLLDAAAFLIGIQNEFYTRFIGAIRDTGFEGEIVASNWQAGSTVGHLLNLHSDYLAGIVDRHNYFGGNIQAFRKMGSFKDGSMLARPGSGMLSAGFQQVEGRPFMLSEWIHVQPNEWYAEGPAILGAYGCGLNGWDVSYMFQNRDDGGFSDRLGKQAWDVSNPAVMGVFPAVSRHVRRMDICESEESLLLKVHIPSLLEGKTGFLGEVRQEHDIKSLATDKVGPEALAALRVAVQFTEAFEDTEEYDLSSCMEDGALSSTTGQLKWIAAKDSSTKEGYFTINTPATKAFVGFSPGEDFIDLGDGYSIRPGKGFSVIYLSAKGKDEDLKSASEIVVTAMARVRNSGMKLNEDENSLLAAGEAPIIMEPVKAEVRVPFRGRLLVLDQDGNAATREQKFSRTFGIDGAMDQTPFYLIRK